MPFFLLIIQINLICLIIRNLCGLPQYRNYTPNGVVVVVAKKIINKFILGILRLFFNKIKTLNTQIKSLVASVFFDIQHSLTTYTNHSLRIITIYRIRSRPNIITETRTCRQIATGNPTRILIHRCSIYTTRRWASHT